MKVLVYFQPSPKHDNFEGARMRKTIKGALEVIGQKYTSNLYDEYDVAHFMSPEDESKLAVPLERKVPNKAETITGTFLSKAILSLFSSSGDIKCATSYSS